MSYGRYAHRKAAAAASKPSNIAATPISRRKVLAAAAAAGASTAIAMPRLGLAQQSKSELAGKTIDMTILGIAGWLPSKLGVDMSPLFTEYAKKRYGYTARFAFAEAPFTALFQKAATSLATRSQEYNIIISDSQWLGALAAPGWIANVSKLIQKNPELNVEWYAPIIRDSYQVYPDGTNNLWGFPEEGDTMVLFVRKDMLADAAEKANFKQKHGQDLPQTWEDFEKLSMDDFEKVAAFFTRPDKGLYGTAMQYSRVYDFITAYAYPFMFSQGGDIWDPKTGQVYGILNSDINARALEQLKAWLKYQPPGAVNYGIPENIDAFAQGKVFSSFMWAAVGPAMITKELTDKVMVVPPPGFKGANGLKRLYCIGGQPWVINNFNDAAHMQVAVDFMKWWYLPETQLEYAHRGGNPCDKATVSRTDFDSIHPWYRSYKYMLFHSRDFWHDPKYSPMLSVQQEAFTSYVTGQTKDAMQALTYAACAQQKILHEEGTAKQPPPTSCASVKL